MSQNSNLSLVHIGLQSAATAWGTVASSLVSLDADPMNPAIDKERLQSWEGVQTYPGVVAPKDGQLPDDPTGAKASAAPAE